MKKILFSLLFISLMVVIGCKSNPSSKTDKKATDKVLNPNLKTVGI